MKARKKTVIEVIQYNSYNLREILERCNNANFKDGVLSFTTSNGEQIVNIGDYINVGDKEPYPIAINYFLNNYEVVE